MYNVDVKLTVRLPVLVRNWLALRAEKNRRSMNAEFVSILEALMTSEKGTTP